MSNSLLSYINERGNKNKNNVQGILNFSDVDESQTVDCSWDIFLSCLSAGWLPFSGKHDDLEWEREIGQQNRGDREDRSRKIRYVRCLFLFCFFVSLLFLLFFGGLFFVTVVGVFFCVSIFIFIFLFIYFYLFFYYM